MYVSSVLFRCDHRCHFSYQNEVVLRESETSSGELSLFVRLGEFIQTELKPHFPEYSLVICVGW